ncbi:CLUMA_CG000855, isoform A [Clunio marinus]|uniref:CLUMA_CG000855, isoform A n=1 Tax=Clunio marinus TaxID=568069 RepID=A0A1J1HHW5_9DIPT|nr:CLUMA_CG000855, isoform A [Clunio marinus]
MPTSAVYQPTTVSFENSGGSLLAQTTTSSRLKTAFRKPWMQTLLLLAGLFFIALGIVLTVSAFADYEDVMANEDIVKDLPPHEMEYDIFFVFLGVFFTIFGFVLLGLYIKVADCWRRNCIVCPCSYGRKKQGLARQLQGQSGGQIMALNPSTDPLVSHTQYAPVSEIPRLEDEEERKTLMYDKDGGNTAEESQLLGPDPRIVLRPSTQVDDA